jgi:hypothetical protein
LVLAVRSLGEGLWCEALAKQYLWCEALAKQYLWCEALAKQYLWCEALAKHYLIFFRIKAGIPSSSSSSYPFSSPFFFAGSA